jgi:hypothetical protein
VAAHFGEVGVSDWQPIETLPENHQVLVCMAYDIQGDELETCVWVDWHYKDRDGRKRWFAYPSLIHIPFPPTHWREIPPLPVFA